MEQNKVDDVEVIIEALLAYNNNRIIFSKILSKIDKNNKFFRVIKRITVKFYPYRNLPLNPKLMCCFENVTCSSFSDPCVSRT